MNAMPLSCVLKGDSWEVPAGMRNSELCSQAEAQGLSNLEFLVGIPGTLGGAVFMNAGSHNSEISQFLKWVELVTPEGHINRIDRKDLSMQYRDGGISSNHLLYKVCLRVKEESKETVSFRHITLLKQRAEKVRFPPHIGTAGSAFRNPPGRRAWELIDQAQCRGLKRGGAEISQHHANFLINTGTATPEDLEILGESVRQRVLEKTGILLEWEISLLGKS
jgi:UDP-N-acetylmuramate dehydrogenase